MAWRSRRHTRRAVHGLTLLGIALFLLHTFQLLDFSTRRYDTWAWTKPCPRDSSQTKQSCTATKVTIGQDVQIVVKTGGSESQNRLRYQLTTILSKIPPENILIFSDLEEKVGSYDVYDVYADLSEQERAEYHEFALYDLQQAYKREGNVTRELAGGWDLAK
jgi:hypothetical protein